MPTRGLAGICVTGGPDIRRRIPVACEGSSYKAVPQGRNEELVFQQQRYDSPHGVQQSIGEAMQCAYTLKVDMPWRVLGVASVRYSVLNRVGREGLPKP
jgi:hypothetical protein